MPCVRACLSNTLRGTTTFQLRGRLDVTRQFSVLAVSPQKLACRFDERSPDIALNQVMRATISKLSRLAQAPDNPHHGDLPPEPIRRPYSIAKPDAHERLTVATLDLTGSRRNHEKALKTLVEAVRPRRPNVTVQA